jgi:hypothetical protein
MEAHRQATVTAPQQHQQDLALPHAVIGLSAKTLTTALAGVVGCTWLASMFGQLAVYVWGQQFPWLDSLAWWFLVVTDGNVPAWVSSLLLLVTALLLLVIALVTRATRGRDVGYWSALALLLLYLSADEILELHERAITPLETMFGAQSIYSRWAIWGLVVAALVGLLFVRFLLQLPPKTRALFVLAGVLYVGGAAGMELIGRTYADGLSIQLVGGHYEDPSGQINLIYPLFGHIEELLEMLGVVTAIYALLTYLTSVTSELRIQLHGNGADGTHRPAPTLKP